MEHRYTSRFRRKVNRHLARQRLRENLGAWVRAWVVNSLCIGGLLSIFAFQIRQVAGDQPLTAYLFLPFGFAAGVMLVYYFVHYHQSLDAMDRHYRESGDGMHEAFFDDDRWGVTDHNGVTVTIPWTLMEITLETDDAWIVDYGSDEMTVDRVGLREAGLEDEFRARVGKVE
jgi:hypothetical protein